MTPALLFVDIQLDFLARRGIFPSAGELVDRAAFLLEVCRKMGIPIVHAHTVVKKDGSNAMPHWKRQGIRECVEGTPGCSPPEKLLPLKGEPVFTKQFFSAFKDGYLGKTLRDIRACPVIVAGIFLHGCIRSTVLSAYERGFEVWIADDVTADNDPGHGKITRQYLSGRAAIFLSTEEIIRRLKKTVLSDYCQSGHDSPLGYIRGRWVPGHGNLIKSHMNPSNAKETLTRVPYASGADITHAISAVKEAGKIWRQKDLESRAKLLENWAFRLEQRKVDLGRMMALELGKPVTFGQEEIAFAVETLRKAVVPAIYGHRRVAPISKKVSECRRAPGLVGIITPWNNPVLIPVGKIAPALGFGNGVVWKAAPQTALTTQIIVETLQAAGLSESIFAVLFGGAKTSADLVVHPDIDAVSFTGSCESGIEIAQLCALNPKPLQAELGGNNAVIIMPDADLEKAACESARSAFGFSGQRCTAAQRFIVCRKVRSAFEQTLVAAIKSLRLGDPLGQETEVGPVISRQKGQALLSIVSKAIRQGAQLLCGGGFSDGWEAGSWFEPTLLFSPTPDLDVVKEEIFGPIAVIQSACDWEEAIGLLNSVKQGLVASLYTHDPRVQRSFLDNAKCGILKLNQPTAGAHPQAPFIGWKASGFGPPEHGNWDREFYTRPQALYGWKLD